MTKKKRQGDPGESSDSNGENEGNRKLNRVFLGFKIDFDISVPTCPHASKSVNVAEVRKKLRENLVNDCFDCLREEKKTGVVREEKDEIGICVRCGVCRCLTGGKHAEFHSKNCQSEPHDVTMDTQTLNVW